MTTLLTNITFGRDRENHDFPIYYFFFCEDKYMNKNI